MASAQPAAGITIFPAGQKQARVDLPALMVEVDAGSFSQDPQKLLADVNAAVTAGATAVLLGEGSAGGAGAAGLYEAAVQLKSLLRGRAALLLLDRTDIATAVDAEGVVLSPAGVPVVVARKMLQGATLVGQLASDVPAAVTAAADGANFVLLRGPGGGLPSPEDVKQAKQQQRSGTAIPVIATASGDAAAAGGAAASVQKLLGGVEGFGLPVGALKAAAAGAAGAAEAPASIEASVGTLLRALTEGNAGDAAGAAESAATAAPAIVRVLSGGSEGGSTLRRLLGAGREAEVEAIISDERELLQQVLDLLQEVVPQMDELVLLRDSLAALDDVFLVVVVGEFNSGKSTVINALLGEKFLADGILPTTNEISILKHLEPGREGPGAAAGELVQERDGLFVRRLPADLLREMNIVDTPGTNVIVERQQRLTEEFVPRADMVLFVLSADRPLTDSELTFLRYIRQWRKKVVFVVNKVDLLESEDEVQQLLDFVSDNARRLLSLDAPSVLPVSSKAALRAKLECGSAVHSGAMDSVADDLLQEHPAWQSSRFGAFERFIYDFLVGGGGGAGGIGEGLRLKLQTPLFVADALVGAASRQLEAEIAAAEGELAALAAVRAQLARFGDDMRKDGAAQRAAARDLVSAVAARAERFVDRTVQLSNVAAAGAYVFGGPGGAAGLPVAKGFDSEVVQGATDQMAGLVSEHAGWLASNCEAQAEYYAGYLAARRRPQQRSEQQQQGGAAPAAPLASSSGGSEQAAGGGAAALAAARAAGGGAAAAAGGSLKAVSDFNLGAAKVLLEEEIREAFLGTAGSAAGAQGLGLLAAGWLHNTLEDLLALTVAGLASYVSVLNLPLKRSEIKSKISKISGNFANAVTAAMEAELDDEVERTVATALAAVAPLEGAWEEELSTLRESERRRAELGEALAAMERRAANLQ